MAHVIVLTNLQTGILFAIENIKQKELLRNYKYLSLGTYM